MTGIFISYRRQDTSYIAGRLHDRLAAHFGPEQIFRDIDTMKPGVEFGRHIERAVGSCDALLVVIGDGWLDSRDAQGQRRIDAPRDWVRQEIAVALERPDVLVVPVLVENATMPSEEDLPPPIRELANRNAMELSDRRWDYEVQHLIEALEEVVRRPAEPEPEPAAAGTTYSPQPQWGAPPPVPPRWQPTTYRGGPDAPATTLPPPEPRRSGMPTWLKVAVPVLVLAALVIVPVTLLSRDGDDGGRGRGGDGSTTLGTSGQTRPSQRSTTTLRVTTTRVVNGPFTGKSGALTLTVQKVEIGTSQIRVHLLVINSTSDAITLPTQGFTAIDNTGRSYKVDVFSKGWPRDVPAGERVTGVIDITEPPQPGAATMRTGWSTVFVAGFTPIRSIFVDKVRLA